MVRAAYCVPLGIPGQKSDPGRSCRIREREAPLAVANSRVVVTGRVVGNPYVSGLGKSCPLCIPNLTFAKTSEVQFEFVPHGHEGAVSNAVTTA